jgi:hypothetical protein
MIRCEPINGGEELLLDIEESLLDRLNRYVVLIYDFTYGTMEFHRIHVPRMNEREIWIITEDSYTDNLDNEAFTYFKYKVK